MSDKTTCPMSGQPAGPERLEDGRAVCPVCGGHYRPTQAGNLRYHMADRRRVVEQNAQAGHVETASREPNRDGRHEQNAQSGTWDHAMAAERVAEDAEDGRATTRSVMLGLHAIAQTEDGVERLEQYRKFVGRLPGHLIPWLVAGLADTVFRPR